MAIVKNITLLRDQSGAALLEFTVVAMVMLTVLFGVIEFSLAYFQWNAATKAMQVGARLAVVSSPVWDEIDTLKGDEKGDAAGDKLNQNDGNTFSYSVTCVRPDPGAAGTCAFNAGGNGTGSGGLGTDMDEAALDTIVFGRGSTACNDAASTPSPGMCDFFQEIGVENVRITYEHSNLGYVTRPGGMVPTVRLELIGLNFNFIFLDDLMGLDNIQMPGLVTTLSAEDMCISAPTVNPKWVDTC